jgi:hypothetical protein
MRITAHTGIVRLAMLLSAVVMIGLTPAVAFAAPLDTKTSVCQHVLQGANSGGLTKELIGVTPNADGTTTLTYAVVTPRPLATTTYDKLDDCATVDGVAKYGKEIKPVSLSLCPASPSFPCPVGSSYTTFTLTVSSADFAKTLCDRAALSGTFGGVSFEDFTDKSNLNCSKTPVPVGALGGLGFVLLTSGIFAAYYVGRRH